MQRHFFRHEYVNYCFSPQGYIVVQGKVVIQKDNDFPTCCVSGDYFRVRPGELRFEVNYLIRLLQLALYTVFYIYARGFTFCNQTFDQLNTQISAFPLLKLEH